MEVRDTEGYTPMRRLVEKVPDAAMVISECQGQIPDT